MPLFFVHRSGHCTSSSSVLLKQQERIFKPVMAQGFYFGIGHNHNSIYMFLNHLLCIDIPMTILLFAFFGIAYFHLNFWVEKKSLKHMFITQNSFRAVPKIWRKDMDPKALFPITITVWNVIVLTCTGHLRETSDTKRATTIFFIWHS